MLTKRNSGKLYSEVDQFVFLIYVKFGLLFSKSLVMIAYSFNYERIGADGIFNVINKLYLLKSIKIELIYLELSMNLYVDFQIISLLLNTNLHIFSRFQIFA